MLHLIVYGTVGFLFYTSNISFIFIIKENIRYLCKFRSLSSEQINFNIFLKHDNQICTEAINLMHIQIPLNLKRNRRDKLPKLQQWCSINLTPYSTTHPSHINFFRQTNVNVRTPLNKFQDLTTNICCCVNIK